MEHTLNFSGTITKVTADGRSAVVTLNETVAGHGLAVISPETRGRVSIMDSTGDLENGRRVVGVATRGVDALRVVSVSAETNR